MPPRIRLIGGVTVDSSSGPVLLGPARQRAVLAVLLLAEGRPVSADDLVERVWGDDPPAAARQALRSYVCRLRQSVAELPQLRIESASGGYVARCAADLVDLGRARALGRRAHTLRDAGDVAGAQASFREALDLCRGEPLPGLMSPWLDDQRRAIEHGRRSMELEYNDLALQLGEAAHILPDLITAVAAEPYDERFAGQLILALHSTGRTADALDTYDRVRRRLRDDLGTDPGGALREVHRLLLQPGPQPDRVGSRRPSPSRNTRGPVPHQLPPSPAGFVERRAESDRLDDVLLPTSGTGCPVAVLTGIGGVGKTSLAVQWARSHAAEFPDGQLFVDLRGFDPSRAPMSPESALQCLTLALGADPGAVPTELDALVGLYRSLLAGRRILMVVDNAVDSAQARPLLPSGGPAAALVTSRSAMTGLAADPGARLMQLGMLPPDDSRSLLSRRLGEDRLDREPGAVDRLIASCAGLPLALAVIAGRAALNPHLPLAALADELADDRTRLLSLRAEEPTRDVETAIATTTYALPADTVDAFALLGLAPGPTVGLAAMAAICGRSLTETTRLAHSLGSLHLLEQPYAGRFRMHDLVRLYAAQLGRRHRDADVAVARLLGFYRERARQTGHAGEDFVVAEAPALVAATELAAEAGHHAAVCDLAEALEGHLGAIGCWRELGRLTELGVASAWQLGDTTRQIGMLVGFGRSRIGLAELGQAAAVLDRALELAETSGDRGAQASVHRALATLAAQQQRPDQSLPHDQRALELCQAVGDRRGEATAYNAIGWHLAHVDRAAAQALVSCGRALTLFTELGDRSGQAVALNRLGYAHAQLGQHAAAQASYRASAELGARLGWQVVRTESLCKRVAESCIATGAPDQAKWGYPSTTRSYSSTTRSYPSTTKAFSSGVGSSAA